MEKSLVLHIWNEVSEAVKDEVINPSVFTALEHVVPIDIQENTLIIGFAAQDTPLIGYVTSAATMPIIKRCLSESMKMPMEVMVVEGTSLDEYYAHEALLAKAKKVVDSVNEERAAKRKIENMWEVCGDKCIREFTAMENKGFAINKAIFMRKAFKIVNDLCKEINYKYKSDPLHDRCLSRLFDRLETALEIPASVLAYLFFLAQEDKKL